MDLKLPGLLTDMMGQTVTDAADPVDGPANRATGGRPITSLMPSNVWVKDSFDGVASSLVAQPNSAPSVTPAYVVPTTALAVRPNRVGQVAAGLGLAARSPLYLAAFPFAALPALVAGVKAESPFTVRGFGVAFARRYRELMHKFFPIIQQPVEDLVETMADPKGMFFIDRQSDPTTAIITVRLHLTGNPDDIRKVQSEEAAIEGHLAIPGYRVNLEFVDAPGPMINEVSLDRAVWSWEYCWNPADDHDVFAHETMHLLGMDDEYDYATHLDNQQMPQIERIGLLLEALVLASVPADAEKGIMTYNSNPPLPRMYQQILSQPHV